MDEVNIILSSKLYCLYYPLTILEIGMMFLFSLSSESWEKKCWLEIQQPNSKPNTHRTVKWNSNHCRYEI